MVDTTLISEAEEAEFGNRHPRGRSRWMMSLIAAGWSLFQLASAQLVLIDSVIGRCVHLAFAIALVFLSFTPFKEGRFLSDTSRVSPLDWLMALVATAAALYFAINYDAIATRQGAPTWLDVAAGVTLILLLLEAARRALGPALPIAASIFILSSLFASSLPSFLASRDVSITHLVSKLTLSTEGIYGIPLRISADTIFLFVLFGAMLERSGGGQYFVQLAFSLLGRYRGGPAKAAVLASGLTGLVSGSSIANTVTTGTFTIPLMKRCGYPPTKAAAIEVAASTNGQLMPPIMGAAAFIIAEYCNVQYMEVVRAAFIPAILSYLALIYITHLEAGKLGLRKLTQDELPRFWQTFIGGIHFLIPLLLLVYLLVIERRSPALSAYYAILALTAVETVRYLYTGVRGGVGLWGGVKGSVSLVWDSLVTGAKNMMGIGVAVGAAGIIVGVVSLGLGGKVTEVIDVLSGGHILAILVITAIVSLILGMGLPTTANYIVMANLTAPAIVLLADRADLAIPLLAAHLFVFYFGILADDTPPVGLAAYAASAIAKSPPVKTAVQGFTYDIRTALLPFMFIFNTDLLLIDVHGFWSAAAVFVMGLVALLAFANVTLQWMVSKLALWQSAALVACCASLFQPRMLSTWFGLEVAWVIAAGFALYALVAATQIAGQKR